LRTRCPPGGEAPGREVKSRTGRSVHRSKRACGELNMRELSERDIGFVSGGTGDPDLVLPTVRVTAPRGSGVSPFYSIQAMHADGGGGFGANLLLAQAVEPEEAPLVMDPVIVDGATPEASPPISEDNPGCNVYVNSLFAQVVETCIDEDGNITQRVTPYDPELPVPGRVTDV